MSRGAPPGGFLGNRPDQWQARQVGKRQLAVWAAIAVTAALALSACGGGARPSATTSTVSSTPGTTHAPSSTTTTAPKGVAVGQSVTVGGLSLTLVKVSDPLQLGPNTFLNPGQRAIGLELDVENVGARVQSPDISGGISVFDPHGDAYEANMSAKLNGVMDFPIGQTNVNPGASESGWLEVQLPTSAPVAQVVIAVSTSSYQTENATWIVTGS